MELAARSCSLKLVGACHGGKPRTRWWMPEVKEVIELKREAGSEPGWPGVLTGKKGHSCSRCTSKIWSSPWRGTIMWPQRGSGELFGSLGEGGGTPPGFVQQGR